MSSERRINAVYRDSELANKLKKKTINQGILKIHFHILRNPHCNFIRILSSIFRIHVQHNHIFLLSSCRKPRHMRLSSGSQLFLRPLSTSAKILALLTDVEMLSKMYVALRARRLLTFPPFYQKGEVPTNFRKISNRKISRKFFWCKPSFSMRKDGEKVQRWWSGFAKLLYVGV